MAGDLTANLSTSEFSCDCNYDDCVAKQSVDFTLINVLQTTVDDFATRYNCRASIDISGGNRCRKHNADIGGHKKSYHMKLMAGDHTIFIYPDGKKTAISTQELYDYYDAKYPTKFGLGIYKTFVHMDVQRKRKRWDLR